MEAPPHHHRPSIITARAPSIISGASHSLRVSAEQRLSLPQQTHQRVALGRGRLLLGAPLLPEELLPRQPLVHGRLARDEALGQICARGRDVADGRTIRGETKVGVETIISQFCLKQGRCITDTRPAKVSCVFV